MSRWRSKTFTELGLKSPVGPLRLRAHSGAITALSWGACEASGDDPVLQEAARQLTAYFAGARREFDLPLAHGQKGLSARVLDAMCAIPFGETRSYGDLAKELGAAPQAIGQACGSNPIPILIPCHRIVGADSLGGYSGAGGIETKVALLRLEGAAGLLI